MPLDIDGNPSDLIRHAAMAWLIGQHDAIAGDRLRTPDYPTPAFAIRAGCFQTA
ncbi:MULTISPECIES: hypothetical protein [unclassified Methylobacterium]|jgi:hypothetical protein|uniref:hypothetical protein n=1 Tax=unclassified Methylobacterium TaxID=2615210 RepID=UPI000AA2FEA2|nr:MULTISPECIES: hypothetical protein [unclassified Methylobacterium]USU30137.1 hypothetical protein NG677_12045 [Methylobacterium sp. OTU13CASTA1]